MTIVLTIILTGVIGSTILYYYGLYSYYLKFKRNSEKHIHELITFETFKEIIKNNKINFNNHGGGSYINRTYVQIKEVYVLFNFSDYRKYYNWYLKQLRLIETSETEANRVEGYLNKK